MVSQQPNLEIQEEEMDETSVAPSVAIDKGKGKMGEKESKKYPPPPKARQIIDAMELLSPKANGRP